MSGWSNRYLTFMTAFMTALISAQPDNPLRTHMDASPIIVKFGFPIGHENCKGRAIFATTTVMLETPAFNVPNCDFPPPYNKCK
jgi:hypothetical protein